MIGITLQDELDYLDHIPDYYDTMYLDGYTDLEIWRAFGKSQRKKFRREQLQKELEQSVKTDLNEAIDKALDDLLKEFNK